MACGDKKASCCIALLDPKLTITQPARVTALTGIDAIAHALETFVTTRRNPASLVFSREAWRLLASNFEQVLNVPDDLEARSGMQLGASFAGLAIENSMLGATHALANPLTAKYNIPHGHAVGMMLPHVIRFNGEEISAWYSELLEITADISGFPDPRTGSNGLADFVFSLVDKAGLSQRLSDADVEAKDLPSLAANAAEQWTGKFNPRPLSHDQFMNIYQQAF